MNDIMISIVTLVSIALGVGIFMMLGNYLGDIDISRKSSEAIRNREIKRQNEMKLLQ